MNHNLLVGSSSQWCPNIGFIETRTSCLAFILDLSLFGPKSARKWQWLEILRPFAFCFRDVVGEHARVCFEDICFYRLHKEQNNLLGFLFLVCLRLETRNLVCTQCVERQIQLNRILLQTFTERLISNKVFVFQFVLIQQGMLQSRTTNKRNKKT